MEMTNKEKATLRTLLEVHGTVDVLDYVASYARRQRIDSERLGGNVSAWKETEREAKIAALNVQLAWEEAK